MTVDWRENLGWTAALEEAFQPWRAKGLIEGRVVLVYRTLLRVITHQGERWAETGGRIRHHAESIEELPAVGDWVALRASAGDGDALATQVLPRKSAFIRKVPGHSLAPQVICTNVDTVLVVMGLDNDFSVRRLERFLALAHEGKIEPVVALNKADVCDDIEERLAEVQEVAPGVAVHVVSALTGAGVQVLSPLFGHGKTVALVGSSGVGKSTLINQIVGSEVMQTAQTKDDGRGRHTTTRRELLLLPNGGCVIDTPGLREVQLWEAQAGVNRTFDDVDAFAKQCRFSDCAHEAEPGCAVKDALESGALPQERYDAWVQLSLELAAAGVRNAGTSKRRERVGKGRRR